MKNARLATLNLTISRKWFDMIASGEKREEYRSVWNRQVDNLSLRLLNNKPDGLEGNPVAILRNGYRMDSPALLVEIRGLDYRTSGENQHPEWGEPSESHFVLKLGKVVARGTYAEIKARILRLQKDKSRATTKGTVKC